MSMEFQKSYNPTTDRVCQSGNRTSNGDVWSGTSTNYSISSECQQVGRATKQGGFSALKKFCEGTYAAWNQWLPLVQLELNEAIS